MNAPKLKLGCSEILLKHLRENKSDAICFSIVDGKIILQVSTFKYVTCEIFYANSKDMEKKYNTFLFFSGTVTSIR
jgi:hypothetical protein